MLKAFAVRSLLPEMLIGRTVYEGETDVVLIEGGTVLDREMIVLLKEKGVAIFDTALRIRRTKNNASDKDLEIVEPSDLDNMLRSLPACKSILAAGQLATEVFTKHYGIKTIPKMGQYTEFTFEGRTLRLYRMPSSSRAYPMQIEKKAEFYRKMFEEL